MNQELLQFNKENYIVTNENGQIDFVKTNCDSNTTENILKKENLLEEYGNEFKKCDIVIEDLLKKIRKNKRAIIINYVCTAIVIFSFLEAILYAGKLFGDICLVLGFVNTFLNVKNHFLDYNNLKNNKFHLLYLEQKKKELNVKIPMLEKKLKNLKEQVSYKRFNAEIVENRGLDSFQLSEPKTSYRKRVLRKKEGNNI